MILLGILASFFAVHFLYWVVIVPLHMRYADKHGMIYDPNKNEFYRRKPTSK